MKYAVKTKGIDKAKKALQKAQNKIATKALRKGLRDAAKIVLNEIKATIPNESGLTQRFLKVRAGKRDRSKNKIIRFKVITTAPPLKEGETDASAAFYYSFVELGTKYIRHRNYMQKAARKAESQAISLVRSAIKAAL